MGQDMVIKGFVGAPGVDEDPVAIINDQRRFSVFGFRFSVFCFLFSVPLGMLPLPALLSDEEKTLACLLSKEAGADFVKTSTGFASGGATKPRWVPAGVKGSITAGILARCERNSAG